MTNGERIKRMTYSDIADFILNETSRVFQCTHCSYRDKICDKRMNCKKHIIEWLEQEEKQE